MGDLFRWVWVNRVSSREICFFRIGKSMDKINVYRV